MPRTKQNVGVRSANLSQISPKKYGDKPSSVVDDHLSGLNFAI